MKILRAPTYSNRQLFWLVLLVAFALGFGYFSGSWHGQQLSGETELLRYQQDNLREKMHRQEYQANILEVERDVAEQANQRLQEDYAQLLAERDALQRELTFYQRVVAPDTRHGVVVDSARLAALADSDDYYLRLILLQQGGVHQAVDAQLRVTLQGKNSDGEDSVLNLTELAALEHEFAVHYFALTEGTFTLPSGWQPETIEVSVTSGDDEEQQQVYEWSALLADTSTTAQLEPEPVDE